MGDDKIAAYAGLLELLNAVEQEEFIASPSIATVAEAQRRAAAAGLARPSWLEPGATIRFAKASVHMEMPSSAAVLDVLSAKARHASTASRVGVALCALILDVPHAASYQPFAFAVPRALPAPPVLARPSLYTPLYFSVLPITDKAWVSDGSNASVRCKPAALFSLPHAITHSKNSSPRAKRAKRWCSTWVAGAAALLRARPGSHSRIVLLAVGKGINAVIGPVVAGKGRKLDGSKRWGSHVAAEVARAAAPLLCVDGDELSIADSAGCCVYVLFHWDSGAASVLDRELEVALGSRREYAAERMLYFASPRQGMRVSFPKERRPGREH